jgi:uncharacterized SAM-binding protein YcdF (DUF218 family)
MLLSSDSDMPLQPTQPLPIVGGPRSTRPQRRFRWVLPLVLFVVLAIPLLLGSLMGAIYWQARTDEATPSDAIVVLGAAQWNGRPTDVLRARLDRALLLYDEGYAPRIIVTGGKQEGDAFTEAESSRNYLVERGVPDAAILLENSSRSTWGNIEGIRTLLAGSDVHSLLIVSDGFHLFRAEMMARHAGFEVHSSPATESPIEPWSVAEFSYVVRETAGVIAFLPEYLP